MGARSETEVDHSQANATDPDYQSAQARPEEVTVEQQRDELVYKTRLSSLYHRKRERFLDFADRFTKAAVILTGSAAVTMIESSPWVRVSGIGIAVVTALSLVFDYAVKARLHAELARRFVELEASILRKPLREVVDAHIAEWESNLASIEAQEPPIYKGLVDICQAEINHAMGYESDNISLIKRLRAHFF
jgi:hypothetical protein